MEFFKELGILQYISNILFIFRPNETHRESSKIHEVENWSAILQLSTQRLRRHQGGVKSTEFFSDWTISKGPFSLPVSNRWDIFSRCRLSDEVRPDSEKFLIDEISMWLLVGRCMRWSNADVREESSVVAYSAAIVREVSWEIVRREFGWVRAGRSRRRNMMDSVCRKRSQPPPPFPTL